MPHGTLEVLLVKANDLEGQDFFGRMDPYVILTLRTQEKKSTVVKGTDPEWNETFQFTVTSDESDELCLRIMDKDTFSSDDFVGESTIPLESVFEEGKVAPQKYNVVDEKREYSGDIVVGLTFISEDGDDYCGRRSGSGSRRRHGSSDKDDGSRRGGGYGRSGRRSDDDDADDSRRGGGYRKSGKRSDDSDDDDCGGGRGRRGGGRSSRDDDEEESYGGYRESSYRD